MVGRASWLINSLLSMHLSTGSSELHNHAKGILYYISIEMMSFSSLTTLLDNLYLADVRVSFIR